MFPMARGRVRLSVTEDSVTPFGGLVPWTAYAKHIGIAEKLAGDCPVKSTNPNAAPVYDIVQSFMLTASTDPAIPERFGMESVVGDDMVRRLSVAPVRERFK